MISGTKRSTSFFVLAFLGIGVGVFLHVLFPSNTPPVREPTVSVASPLPPVSTPAKIHTLLFAGDVMLSRSVGAKIRASGDFRFPFLRIASTTRTADIAFANLEGPISDRGENQGSIYSFRADPRTVEGLSYAGFDVLSLANNHMFDWGQDALSQTVDLLHTAGIRTVGAGNDETEANAPAILDLDGTKVGFLAYTTLLPESFEAQGEIPGISHRGRVSVESAVRALRKDVDLLFVSVHWGNEYEEVSSDTQRVFGHALIDAGADLVVGHHPHVAEEVERYKNGWIAYSLGNFVFDQNFSEETMQGLLLRVSVKGERIEGITTDTAYLDKDFRPSLVP